MKRRADRFHLELKVCERRRAANGGIHPQAQLMLMDLHAAWHMSANPVDSGHRSVSQCALLTSRAVHPACVPSSQTYTSGAGASGNHVHLTMKGLSARHENLMTLKTLAGAQNDGHVISAVSGYAQSASISALASATGFRTDLFCALDLLSVRQSKDLGVVALRHLIKGLRKNSTDYETHHDRDC